LFEGVNAALTADPVWQDGWFATPPTRRFQAIGRVYAGWGLSQAVYRKEILLSGKQDEKSASIRMRECHRMRDEGRA